MIYLVDIDGTPECHACGMPAKKANRLGNNKLMKPHNCPHGKPCAAGLKTAGLHANTNIKCELYMSNALPTPGHKHTAACYSRVPETEGTGEYLNCGLVAGAEAAPQEAGARPDFLIMASMLCLNKGRIGDMLPGELRDFLSDIWEEMELVRRGVPLSQESKK